MCRIATDQPTRPGARIEGPIAPCTSHGRFARAHLDLRDQDVVPAIDHLRILVHA
jgi:hypothetical protein